MSMTCDHKCTQYNHEHHESLTHCYEDLVCMDCGYLQYTRVCWYDGGGTGIVQHDYTYVSPLWHGRLVNQASEQITELMNMYEVTLKEKGDLWDKIRVLESSSSRALKNLLRESKWWLDNLSTAIRLVSEVTTHRGRNENALAAIHDLNAARSGIERTSIETLETLTLAPPARDMDDIPF